MYELHATAYTGTARNLLLAMLNGRNLLEGGMMRGILPKYVQPYQLKYWVIYTIACLMFWAGIILIIAR